jgi:hypothetical protein
MTSGSTTAGGCVLDLDKAEATKLEILSYERLPAHLFCFALAATIGLLAVDAWLVASDLWRAYASGEAAGYVYFDQAARALTLDLALYALVGLAVLLGLANARATGQLKRSHMRRARWGAAALVILFAAFAYYHVHDYDRARRLVLQMAALFSVPFTHWAGMVELALLVAVTLILHGRFNHRVAARLGEEEAFILRDEPSRAFKGRLLRSALGVPRVVDFLPSGRLRTSAAFALANVFYAVSSLFVVFALGVALVHWADAYETCGLGRQDCLEHKAYFYLGVAVIAAVVALLVAPVVGGLCNTWGQRHVRFSVDELLARDERAPILFLRPFRDDQVRLPAARAPFLARIGRWLAGIRNLDSLLLEEGTPYGPVVAIGNPDDDFPPYGAARGYFDDKTWQGAVDDLANKSRAIIICIDDFEGVWWEVENVVSRHLDKTLVLLHPRHAGAEASSGLMRRVAARLGTHPRREQLSAAIGAAPPATSHVSLLGAFVDTDGKLRLAVSSTMSGLAFLVATRTFLRSKWGLA